MSNDLLNVVISGTVGIRLSASKTQTCSNIPEVLKLDPASEALRELVET